MLNKRVLVVATSADFIEVLVEHYGNQLLFVTDPAERAAWNGNGPNPDTISEVLSPIDNEAGMLANIKQHATKHHLEITGVVAFDCESLATAATLAVGLNLPFVSRESVLSCRSKYLSKEIWRKNGVGCPEAKLVHSEEEAAKFLEYLESPAVMKPLSASGSELIFLCTDEKSCRQAYQTTRWKLQQDPNNRLYSETTQAGVDPRKIVLMERCVGGDEYSVDFILEDNQLEIIRIAKKLMRKTGYWGTPLAYILPGDLPSEISEAQLADTLKRAAESLGINRMMGMVDLKIENGKIYLIELSPRSSGDCLPQLIQAASGFDLHQAHLDFAQGKKVIVPTKAQWKKVMGVLFVGQERGLVKELNVSRIMEDPRAISCELYYAAGHQIELPPEDYETRRLGYAVITPDPYQDLEKQCLEILNKLTLEMEPAIASATLR